MSVRAAAKRLGVMQNAIRNRLRRGTIPHFTLDGRAWIFEQAVEIERSVRDGKPVAGYAVLAAGFGGLVWVYSEASLVRIVRLAEPGRTEIWKVAMEMSVDFLICDSGIVPDVMQAIPVRRFGLKGFPRLDFASRE